MPYKGGIKDARGTAIERFHARYIVDSSGCWIWQACKNDAGYGQLFVDGKMVYAHRFSYELVNGSLGSKMGDHICRNHSCVNPDHIQPATNRENTLAGVGPTAINAAKTHCIHGHEFTPENTYIRKDTGHRQCKTCMK